MSELPDVHRDAPAWNGLRTAAIAPGQFPDAASGAAVLRECCATLAREGFEAVVGPMAGSTWARYRLPIWSDGSPAFTMEPTAGAHELAAYEQAGFAVAEEHISATAAPGSRGWAAAGSPVAVESWDGARPEKLLSQAYAVVMTAFRGIPFFRPIPIEAFIGAYLPLLERADPRLILRATDESGLVVGLTLAFPDPLRRGAVVLKTYAGLVPGAGRRMADRVHELAAELGFREVIHALMRRGIASEAQSRKFGGQIFRRYALMGRRL